MNKNAIKKFAIEARKKLIASVSDGAGMLGITAQGCSEPISKGIDFEVYKTVAGTEVTLGRTQCEQRRKLKEQIEARGFEAVVEEVAYTWFNRICAIRFMEVNDYLPTRVRVLSSEKEGKNEPDIVTQAPDVELDFTDKEREYILDCKMNNKLDELFKMLFIKQCNKLSEILPELFEATEDYTEMLLNISYTNKDDIIYMLVNQETGIPEADFNVSTIGEDGQPTGQVEIIGWLYQYYNTELKDDTFAQLKKNVKISKERIPAATQLFTPDWIVRYMVENSVGRLWIEHLRAVDPNVNEKETAEKFGWKYYLPEAEQEADVNVKLAKIRTSYKDLKPEDITCIDPCMGSGHILVAMFDVLMDIYKSVGYSERDAAFEIVEHNIHGLDIDKRAYQLAYFAVMMKGRGYNRRFLRGKESIELRVYEIIESNEINRKHLEYFGESLPEVDRFQAMSDIEQLLDVFANAKIYGYILDVGNRNWELLYRFVRELNDVGQISLETYGCEETQKQLIKILNVAQNLEKKYEVIITNPPYMGKNGMDEKLISYIKDKYNDVKIDLYACCLQRALSSVKRNGYVSMITMETWMFLSSLEKLRKAILKNNMIVCLNHMPYLGKGGTSLGISFGTCAFVIKNTKESHYNGNYMCVRYYETDENGVPFQYPVVNERYGIKTSSSFENIPGGQIAYWASEELLNTFLTGENLLKYVDSFQGIITGDNDKFLRLWYEVDMSKIAIEYSDMALIPLNSKYWIPYNKGGDYKKWYGNQDYVVNWKNGPDDKTRGRKTFEQYYLKEYVSWSYITSSTLACRYFPNGFLWDVHGSGIMDKTNMLFYLQGLISSKVGMALLKVINSTISFQVENIIQIPVLTDEEHKNEIDDLVKRNIAIAKDDWDADETSWNFSRHPLLKFKAITISEAMDKWSRYLIENADETAENEEKITRIFSKIYNISEDELKYVEDRDVTVKLPNSLRDIKSFISYAVGCMFGRYSLDGDGIIYAGGEWNLCQYKTYIPNTVNCIPITDEPYFQEDIVSLFCDFVKCAYGEDYLEENLSYIARNLGKNGQSSREVIRDYFINDFYKDHCNMYSVTGSGKRPIYWLFDSGKQNGFKALIYLHRYNADIVGKIRVDYLHRTQKCVETAMENAKYIVDNSTSAFEKSKAAKMIEKYVKQLGEMKIYDEAIAHIANQRIELDLDDGVKVNYEKFQGIEVAQEGKKALKIDLLAKIK